MPASHDAVQNRDAAARCATRPDRRDVTRPVEGLALLVEQVAGRGRDADRQQVVDLGLRIPSAFTTRGSAPAALQIDVGLAAQMLDRDHPAFELGIAAAALDQMLGAQADA